MFTGEPHKNGCFVCGNPKLYSRGLCQPDYRQLNKELEKVTKEAGKEAAERCEAFYIAQGWILPKSKGGRPRDSNPFEAIARLVIAESKGEYSRESVDQIIASGNDVIDKAVRQRTEAKPKTRPKKAN